MADVTDEIRTSVPLAGGRKEPGERLTRALDDGQRQAAVFIAIAAHVIPVTIVGVARKSPADHLGGPWPAVISRLLRLVLFVGA